MSGPFEIRVELATLDPVSGAVIDGAGAAIEFSGWIGLLSAIGGVIDTAGAEPSG